MCPTPNVTAPYKSVGCGGTAPSPSLELLGVATAMPSKLRLGSEAVAPQRGPPPFPIPLLEGRYRIESELGEGGMATVYLADDIKHEEAMGGLRLLARTAGNKAMVCWGRDELCHAHAVTHPVGRSSFGYRLRRRCARYTE